MADKNLQPSVAASSETNKAIAKDAVKSLFQKVPPLSPLGLNALKKLGNAIMSSDSARSSALRKAEAVAAESGERNAMLIDPSNQSVSASLNVPVLQNRMLVTASDMRKKSGGMNDSSSLDLPSMSMPSHADSQERFRGKSVGVKGGRVIETSQEHAEDSQDVEKLQSIEFSEDDDSAEI